MNPISQIMLIDNDSDANARKQQMLIHNNISKDVKILVNAGIALLYMQQQSHQIRNKPYVIILNTKTPIMDGFEFLSELRNSKEIDMSQLFIIVIKDNINLQQMEKLKVMGANAFVEDDTCVEEIATMLHKHFAALNKPRREGKTRSIQDFAA